MSEFTSSLLVGEDSTQVLSSLDSIRVEELWLGGKLLSKLRGQLFVDDSPFSPSVELLAGEVALPSNQIIPRSQDSPVMVLDGVLSFRSDRPLVDGESLFVAGYASAVQGGLPIAPVKKFFVKGGVSGSVFSSGTDNNIVIFNKISGDSQAYNLETGEVTVPYDGVYLLTTTILIDNEGGMEDYERLALGLFINGEIAGATGYTIYRPGYTGNYGHMQEAGADFLELQAGDKISLGILEPDRSLPINSGGWTRFGVCHLPLG